MAVALRTVPKFKGVNIRSEQTTTKIFGSYALCHYFISKAYNLKLLAFFLLSQSQSLLRKIMVKVRVSRTVRKCCLRVRNGNGNDLGWVRFR